MNERFERGSEPREIIPLNNRLPESAESAAEALLVVVDEIPVEAKALADRLSALSSSAITELDAAWNLEGRSLKLFKFVNSPAAAQQVIAKINTWDSESDLVIKKRLAKELAEFVYDL